MAIPVLRQVVAAIGRRMLEHGGAQGVLLDAPMAVADYVTPPDPEKDFGEQLHPFDFVVEGEDSPAPDGDLESMLICSTTIVIERAFWFSGAGDDRLKHVGGAHQAKIVAAIWVDPTFGGLVCDLNEQHAGTHALPGENNIGVHASRWEVKYLRQLRDATAQ